MSVSRSCHCIGRSCLCGACWYHIACFTLSLFDFTFVCWCFTVALKQLVDTCFSSQRICAVINVLKSMLMFSSWYSALSVAWSLEVEQCCTASLTTCYMPTDTLLKMGWLVLWLAECFVVGSLNGNPFLKEYSGFSPCLCLKKKKKNLGDPARLTMEVNGTNP